MIDKPGGSGPTFDHEKVLPAAAPLTDRKVVRVMPTGVSALLVMLTATPAALVTFTVWLRVKTLPPPSTTCSRNVNPPVLVVVPVMRPDVVMLKPGGSISCVALVGDMLKVKGGVPPTGVNCCA